MQQDETAQFCARLASLSPPPFLTGRALPAADGIMVLYPAWRIVISLSLLLPSLWLLGRIQVDFVWLHLNSFLLESALKEVLNSPPNPDEKWRGGGGRLAQLLTKRPPLRRNVRFEQISWRFG